MPKSSRRIASFGFRHIAGRTRHAVFPRTPSRVHSVRCTLKDRLDLTDLALLDFEHFRKLPGPRIGRSAGYGAAGWSLKCAVLAQRMIEEGKTEDEPAFPIYSDE